MIFDYLQPVSKEIINHIQSLSDQSLGKKVVLHTENEYPNLEKIAIAILFVNENRGAEKEYEANFDALRKYFYSLFPGNWQNNIADLGDVLIGNEINDTYYAVKSICEYLIKQKIIPIVIGGSQDLTFPMYRAYDNLEQMVNLITIDNKFDFAKDNKTDSDSYLSRIIVEEPNNLYNYSCVGYQSYLTSQEEIDLIDKLYFDAFRLGEIITNSSQIEPIFRDADLVSIDLNAVKSSDSGNQFIFNPNGLDGREICKLSRYAGISDKISSFGIFNQSFQNSENPLIAQILWYFIEGYHYRSYEYPFEEKSNYLKYTVLTENEEIVFYKSNRSERWWMEIKIVNSYNNTTKKTLLPCTNDDYISANNAEIPERWWKAQRKNII